jgi:hypothetical protein
VTEKAPESINMENKCITYGVPIVTFATYT